jgi:hypothetical protein
MSKESLISLAGVFMIRIQGLVLLSVFFISTANAGLFGTIESVDVLIEVASHQAKKKDNRAIASDQDAKKIETPSSESSESPSQDKK